MFRRVGIRLAQFLGDLAAVAVAFYLAIWLRPQLEFGKPIAPENVLPAAVIVLLVLLVWGVGFLLTDVYNLQKNLRIIDEFQRLVAAHALATLTFAGILYFTYRDVSRLLVLTFAVTALLLLLAFRGVFRLALHFFGEKRYGARRVLVVGANDVGRKIGRTIQANRWTGLRLIGFLDDNPQADTLNMPNFGPANQTEPVVEAQDINEVIFALPRAEHATLANLVAALHYRRVNVRVVPDFFDLVFLRSVVEDVGDIPLVTLKEPALNPLQRLVKRGFDLIWGGLGFVLALPFMALIALGIKLDSPGPVLFSQERVGENGRVFNMYKFRTMIHDPDAPPPDQTVKVINGQPLYKFYDDPRVTRFGRFLRRTSLDELPQFANVIKGDMSLVGPRPELPCLVDKYDIWQRKRFEVPQGLTGWWQVNGRADKPMHLHTEDDLYYIKNYSLWLDVQILWHTVKAVLSRRGSY